MIQIDMYYHFILVKSPQLVKSNRAKWLSDAGKAEGYMRSFCVGQHLQ